MSQVDLNYLAIFVGAISNMILGFLWYGPIFGKTWIALMGFTNESMEAAKAKGMGKQYTLMFLGALTMSYVLAHFIDYAGAATIPQGIQAGFWVWLGFIAPVTLGSVLWDNKPWKLWFLNNGYYLISLVIMGGILASWI